MFSHPVTEKHDNSPWHATLRSYSFFYYLFYSLSWKPTEFKPNDIYNFAEFSVLKAFCCGVWQKLLKRSKQQAKILLEKRKRRFSFYTCFCFVFFFSDWIIHTMETGLPLWNSLTVIIFYLLCKFWANVRFVFGKDFPALKRIFWDVFWH